MTTLIYAGFPQTMSEYDVRLHLNVLDYTYVLDTAVGVWSSYSIIRTRHFV